VHNQYVYKQFQWCRHNLYADAVRCVKRIFILYTMICIHHICDVHKIIQILQIFCIYNMQFFCIHNRYDRCISVCTKQILFFNMHPSYLWCIHHIWIRRYGMAIISRLLQIMGLFCRILCLLKGSCAKETYDLKEPTNRSHPILIYHVFYV